MNEERKVSRQTIGMIIGAGFIVLMAICLFIAFGVNKCKEDRIEESLNGGRYVVLTDKTTGQTYEILGDNASGVSIEYDGKTHSFSYRIYDKRSKKPTGQKGTLDKSIININDKIYDSVFVNNKDGTQSMLAIIIFISPIKPIWKLDPNGAVNYDDNNWYKYKYTGEPCYPIASVEYEGEVIDADVTMVDRYSLCWVDLREVGIYYITIEVKEYSDDADNELYVKIKQDIRIEIVE